MKNEISKTLSLFLAAITCPCHIFILAALLAGTTAGVFIQSYFIPLVIIFSVLFVISLARALKT